MTISNRFEPYGAVDAGICVIEVEQSSPVIYCNALFSALLSARPDELIGRSLDDLSKAHRLIYDLAVPLAARTKQVALAGGFCFPMFDQVAEGMIRTLRVYRVDMEVFGDTVYLIGYVRRATRFEIWLHRTRLDTNLDPYWKPIVSACFSGKWRPWITATAPLWMPYIVSRWPQLQNLIEAAIAP
jgi:hypothetical protein